MPLPGHGLLPEYERPAKASMLPWGGSLLVPARFSPPSRSWPNLVQSVRALEDYHGVLTPSSPGVAPKGLKSTGTAEFNKVWSYLGTPCISLPLLQGENNMPLGVQLVGARYDDHRFLGVANWLEKECNK